MYPNFTPQQYIPLLIGAVFIFSSIIFFQISKKRIALCLLFIGTLVLGYFMANLDPFLNLWDEQYHALVAKNLSENPLKPTLYKTPVLEYSYQNWTYNHIWLHKQPLFLWQMALSIKTFGVSVISVRLPSIIMHALATLMIYKIGKIVQNERIGFYSALFFSVAYYYLELISGRLPTEHNDSAFLFYIIASFWAWFEYQETKKKYWIFLIGIFSGCAILVKWLVGLLIYSGWILSLGSEGWRNWFRLKSYLPVLTALGTTTLIVLPWQIYILYAFPKEASHEYQSNTDHFFKVVENHNGDNWFHIDAIKQLYGYGDLVPYILLIGIILLISQMKNNGYQIVIISSILIVYTFFTIAATKLTSFTMIVCPFVFIGLATLVNTFFTYIERYLKIQWIKVCLSSVLLGVISFSLINLEQIELNHTFKDHSKNSNRLVKIKEIEQFKKIDSALKGENYIVFYLRSSEQCHMAFMFFYDYIAYDYLPGSDEIEELKSKNYKIAFIEGKDIPNYIYETEDFLKIILD